MRLQSLIPLFALPFALSATSPHQRLVDLAEAGNGVITLDATTYDLLTAGKRNWSASVHLTAMDSKRRCVPCREFDPSWNAVAKAWTKVDKPIRDTHFFATLDFDNAQTVFQKLGLTSAPVVYIHPATEGPRRPKNGKTSPSKFDFSYGFEAGPLAEHMSVHTPVPIPYTPPIDWTKWATGIAATLGLLVTLRYISPILQNRWTWAIGSILTSLIMTSGYMFTRIRNAPYNGGSGQWIAAGYQNQYGQEVYVVAGIYGLLASAFLMLSVVAPYQGSPQRQRAQIYLWSFVILLMYSILVALFKVKNRGYPFRLLL